MAELLANNAIGNLNALITNVAASLILQSGQGALFPPSGNFRVIIDSEIILVGARSGDTLSSLTRADGGTAAAGHSAGAQVTQLITKESFPELVKATTNFPIAGLAGYPSDVTKQLRGDGTWLVGGSLIGVQVFTSGGTYTPTSGTSRIYAEAVGGGGGGGGITGSGVTSKGGSGGGAGAYSSVLSVSGFSGLTITIGAGGTGVSAAGGNAGGTTSLGTILTAAGGGGGAAASDTNQTTGAAGGSTGTGLVAAGGGGGNGGNGIGGPGGVSFFGGGGGLIVLTGNAAGTALAGLGASAKGAGGGGAAGVSFGSTPAAQAGGGGGSGLIRIWEFA